MMKIVVWVRWLFDVLYIAYRTGIGIPTWRVYELDFTLFGGFAHCAAADNHKLRILLFLTQTVWHTSK